MRKDCVDRGASGCRRVEEEGWNDDVAGLFFFFSSRRRHTRFDCDWSSDVCSSDLVAHPLKATMTAPYRRLRLERNLLEPRINGVTMSQGPAEKSPSPELAGSTVFPLFSSMPYFRWTSFILATLS